MTKLDLALVERALSLRSELPMAPPAGARYAAVASVLREHDDDLEVLLIRRADSKGDPWSGHMAFPGGRHDPTDTDLRRTAEREAREEVGLDLERDGRLLGRLDDVEAIARARRIDMRIAPFVFAVHGNPTLVPNYEVASALWVPLSPLYRGEHQTRKHYEMAGQRLVLPAWEVAGHVVWGLTYRMLATLLDELRRAAER